MRFLVRPLRYRGRRLAWRDVQNSTPFDGDIVTYELHTKGGRVFAATLNGRDPAAAKALPDLYEPVLVGMAPSAFRLRGFERHYGPDGPYSVAQEWHCEMA
jgi:hypothetical protein